MTRRVLLVASYNEKTLRRFWIAPIMIKRKKGFRVFFFTRETRNCFEFNELVREKAVIPAKGVQGRDENSNILKRHLSSRKEGLFEKKSIKSSHVAHHIKSPLTEFSRILNKNYTSGILMVWAFNRCIRLSLKSQ